CSFLLCSYLLYRVLSGVLCRKFPSLILLLWSAPVPLPDHRFPPRGSPPEALPHCRGSPHSPWAPAALPRPPDPLPLPEPCRLWTDVHSGTVSCRFRQESVYRSARSPSDRSGGQPYP